MIDWVTCLLPLKHLPIESGRVIKFDNDGSIEWETRCRLSVEGSYSSSITIKSDGVDEHEDGYCSNILLSGNPAKYLQGHNIFGIDDVKRLVYLVYVDICKKLDIKPNYDDLQKVENGDYLIKMIDINFSYSTGSRANARSVIRALEYKSSTRHGRPVMKGGTIYFGKTSRRWALKMYVKADEIEKKDREIPLEIRSKELTDWVEDKLRVELRLLSKELKELGLNKAKSWTPEIVKQLFSEYIGKVDMSDQIKLTNEQLEKMPAKLRSTYILWSQGYDLRNILSRRTYYRHRAELKEYGVNIDYLATETNDDVTVVNFKRVIDCVPAEIPDFAYRLGLIAA